MKRCRTGGAAEQRNEPRAGQLGTALLHLNKWWTNEYRIANVSASGALLCDGPRLRVGRTVRAVLRLGGLQPVGVDVRVVRVLNARSDGSPPAGVAVRFVNLEPALEDLIHDVVLAALSGRRLRPLSMHETIDWVPLDGVSEAWLG